MYAATSSTKKSLMRHKIEMFNCRSKKKKLLAFIYQIMDKAKTFLKKIICAEERGCHEPVNYR